jgi:predicted DNA-binding protein YlxM (UPF0122 family)
MSLQFASVTSDKLPQWAAKYCTKTQAKYLISYFFCGQTESEIASENEVTQQAVSKGIKKGLKRLRSGLRKDRIVEFED